MYNSHDFMHLWSFPMTITLWLVAFAFIYTRGWNRLRQSLPDVIPGWRLAAFQTGLLSVWAAVASPLASLDHQLLTFHMLKHLVLMTIAAPLILLGAPFAVLCCGLPRCRVSVHAPLLFLGMMHKVSRILTHPVFCCLAGSGVMIFWHIPVAFDLSMQSMWWHRVQQASFVAAGLLFWWPVIRPWPSVARLPEWIIPLYLFLATLPCDALSAFLTFRGQVAYPIYLSIPQAFGVSALQDQECAGAVMWVWVGIAYLIPAIVFTTRMLSPRISTSKKNAERSPDV